MTDPPQTQVVPREENTEAVDGISLILAESSIAMVGEATFSQHDQRASLTQMEAAAIETELDELTNLDPQEQPELKRSLRSKKKSCKTLTWLQKRPMTENRQQSLPTAPPN